MAAQASKTAILYRMVMPQHICPYGISARYLLKHRGYVVEDHWLATRAAQDNFKSQHGVATTPQIFIDGERIGGYDDLRRFFGLPVRDPAARSYVPVLAVFAVAALLGAVASHATGTAIFSLPSLANFVAIAMTLLAMLKLQDVGRFVTMFLGYDLLAQRYVHTHIAIPSSSLAPVSSCSAASRCGYRFP